MEAPMSENKNEYDRGSTRRVVSHLHSNPSVLIDSSSYMIDADALEEIRDDDDDDDDDDDELVEEMIMDIA